MSKWQRFLLVCAGLFLSAPAFAYKVRCNEQQTICEVDTKRLVIGDKIGIFDGDGYIVAIGKIIRLRGRMRVVKIEKKYSSINRSHELELIRDEEAQNPQQFFKFHKATAKRAGGAQIGFTSMGVGEGFNAMDLQGYMQFDFRENSFYLGRLMFLNGKGSATATDNVDSLQSEDMSITLFGLLGGASYILWPHRPITLRGEAALGLGQLSATITGGGDVEDYVDGRVKPGLASIIRLEASAIFKVGDYKPMASVAFARIQNSNNPGVFGGIFFEF